MDSKFCNILIEPTKFGPKFCQMDHRVFRFATRGQCIKGKQWNLKKICVCVQNNLAYFPFMHCPLVANWKTRWSIGKVPDPIHSKFFIQSSKLCAFLSIKTFCLSLQNASLKAKYALLKLLRHFMCPILVVSVVRLSPEKQFITSTTGPKLCN